MLETPPKDLFRTLLVLGRISNLPTVWSNCLAAWMLAGGGQATWGVLEAVFVGSSLLYLAGMLLNDACDARLDALYRPERPIPAGRIGRRTVGVLGIVHLATGVAVLPEVARGWGGVLAGLIVLYTLVHKRTAAGVFVMAACRVVLYPLAASARTGTVSLGAIPPGVWIAGVAMGGWVLALSVLARTESRPGPRCGWALWLLALPPALAVWARFGLAGASPAPVAVWTAPIVLWMGVRIWTAAAWRNPARPVPDLLAAIPMLDLISASPRTNLDAAFFFTFMILALLMRRSIPPS